MMEKEEREAEYNELLKQLSNPELISNWEKFEELSRRKNFLEKIIEKEKELQGLQEKIEENNGILKSKEDLELFSLAEAEIAQLKERQNKLEGEIKTLLSEGEKEDLPKSVIVEIRAGTGGEEAGLFVADLFRMYSKYAQSQNWRQKLLDSRESSQGGFKEIVFELAGTEVFQSIMNEGGVHRVQRIPQTEKSGRIHTSTATVAVLPKPKKTQIKIKPEDMRVDFYRASGPGGQYVNKRETAVRITHLPTGIVVTSQTERNQLQNKENALSILAAKILEKKEMEESRRLGGKRKAQIGRAQRAEKIRTYNFPQDRITDHRIKKTFHNIEGVMAGKLEPLVGALKKSQP